MMYVIVVVDNDCKKSKNSTKNFCIPFSFVRSRKQQIKLLHLLVLLYIVTSPLQILQCDQRARVLNSNQYWNFMFINCVPKIHIPLKANAHQQFSIWKCENKFLKTNTAQETRQDFHEHTHTHTALCEMISYVVNICN